ncbi:hypothetical protein N9087_00265 [bacterium]|nr:hypothetical protein [bacterium]
MAAAVVISSSEQLRVFMPNVNEGVVLLSANLFWHRVAFVEGMDQVSLSLSQVRIA